MRQASPLLRLLVLLLLLAGGVRDSGAQSDGLSDLFGQGTAEQAAGNHREAARIFREVLAGFEREDLTMSATAGLVWARLGESLLAIGDPGADPAFDKALPLLRRASDMEPYFNLAVALAETRLAQNRNGEAATLAEGLLSRAAMEGVSEATLAQAINAGALIFRHAGHHEKADATLEMALGLTGTDARASSLRGLARVFRARRAQVEGRFAEMEKEIALGLVDLERSGPGAADSMAAMLLLRAQLRFSEGRYRAALDETEEAYKKVVEAKLPEEAWLDAVSLRVRLLERLHRTADAVALADEMVATLETARGAEDKFTMLARLMRVECLLRALRYDEARAGLAALAPRLAASDDPDLRPTFDLRRGDLALVDGNVVAALAAAESAYNVSVKAFPHTPTAIVEPLRLRAYATNASDDFAFAELAHRELLDLSAQAYGTGHPEYAEDLSSFAAWLSTRLRFSEAETIYRRAAALIEASYGADSAKFAGALSNVATTISKDSRRAAEAVPLLERAIAIIDRLGDLPRQAALLRFNLASAIVFLGRHQEALELSEAARRIYVALPGSSKKQSFMFDVAAMQYLGAMGRIDEALENGLRMANTATVETTEDLQAYVQGLTDLARIASVGGYPELALKASRRAMDETSRLGHETGAAYKWSAAALARSAWHMTQTATP